MSLKILFAGTPEIALPSLIRIVETFSIVGVLTGEDTEAGRNRKLKGSPVKLKATELGLPVISPEKLDSTVRAQIQSLAPDLLVVAAYGKIFGPKFLQLFPKGAINLHPSLLPKYRGPSPIPAAILAGDSETGVTIQKISLQMDAGPILLQEVIPLNGSETTVSLTKICADLGADLLIKALEQIESGTITETNQNEQQATYCTLLSKENGRIQWNLPVSEIERMIRAFVPWPSAWTLFRGDQLKILGASVFHPTERGTEAGKIIGVDKGKGILVQTGKGILSIHQLQYQGRNALDFASFLNGMRNFIGSVLGE